MTRFLLLLSFALACSDSDDPMVDLDGGMPADDASLEDSAADDSSMPLDSSPLDDAGDADVAPEDASIDAPPVPVDSGIDPCPIGVYHEPTNRCFFTVLSRDSGLNPCPAGSRLARWFDQDDQRLIQSFLASGSLDSRSVTTSLRRRGYVSGAPWVWDDRTPAPAGLVWASTGHPNLAHAYLTPDGLAPYHRDQRWTLCEGMAGL